MAFNSIKETVSHASLKVATSLLLAIPSASSFAQAAAETAIATPGAAPAVEVSNPYGLGALWETSDGITKTVLLILLIMSVGSWYIIATKFLQNRKFHAQSLQTNEEFWKGKTIKEGASHLDEASPYRFIAESGSNAVQSHVGMKKNIPLNDWLEMNIQSAVDRIQNQTQSGLSFLATVGSTSPFV